MRVPSPLALLVTTLISAAPLVGALAAPPAEVPEARQVVVRRIQSLEDAILAAFGGRTDTAEGTAALVIDVTPYTRRHAEAIGEALRAIDDHPRVPRPWRVAALGRPFLDGLRSPGEVSFQLPALLAENSDAEDTIGALARPSRASRVAAAP